MQYFRQENCLFLLYFRRSTLNKAGKLEFAFCTSTCIRKHLGTPDFIGNYRTFHSPANWSYCANLLQNRAFCSSENDHLCCWVRSENRETPEDHRESSKATVRNCVGWIRPEMKMFCPDYMLRNVTSRIFPWEFLYYFWWHVVSAISWRGIS